MASELGAGCVDGPVSRLGEPAAGEGWTDRRSGQLHRQVRLRDEFQPERAEDGGVVPAEDYGLLLDELEGSSEETSVYHNTDAEEEDTDTSADPVAARSGGGDA